MWDEIGRLHACHGEVPVEVRLLKLTEEVGEVADAYIAGRSTRRTHFERRITTVTTRAQP
jgi:hypothetical protein